MSATPESTKAVIATGDGPMPTVSWSATRALGTASDAPATAPMRPGRRRTPSAVPWPASSGAAVAPAAAQGIDR